MRDSAKKVSRRTFLSRTAIASAAVVGSPYIVRSAIAAQEITLFTWETYSEEPWLAEYTEKTGVKVNAVRAGSVDDMFSRIRSGAVNPDLIYLDTSTLPRFMEMDYLVPIDTSKLPNLQNVSPAIDYAKSARFDGKIYGVPYNWGPIPMMYNADIVKKDVDSWRTLWDPKYKGRVSVIDDSFTSIPIVAMVAGATNPYKMTDAEFEACTQLLRTLRPQVKAITAGNDDTKTLYGAGEVDIGMCMNPPIVANLQKEGKNIAYSIPKEGVPSWLELTYISKSGDRPAVYDFLNETLSLEWQKRFIEFATSPGIFDTKIAAAQNVNPDVIKQTVMPLLDTPGFWNTLRMFEVVENTDRRLQLWNDFKAGTL